MIRSKTPVSTDPSLPQRSTMPTTPSTPSASKKTATTSSGGTKTKSNCPSTPMKSPTARQSTTFGIMTILITIIIIITTVVVGLSVTAPGIVIAIGDIAQIRTDHTLIADAHGEDADRIDQNTANTFGSIANIIIMNRESNREDHPRIDNNLFIIPGDLG